MKSVPRRSSGRASFAWVAVFAAALQIVAGPGRALAQRPLGIDVSSYQGSAQNPPTNITWTSVKSAGITYAWAKATEGLTYVDADFVYNVTNARNAGVLIGAYHFAHPDTHPGTSGADQEAAAFWAVAGPYIKGGGTYLMPMLDAEVASPGTQSAVSTWVNQWCQDLVNYGTSNGVVVKPIVYTYISWASSYLNSTVTQWPLWMASPNGQDPQTGAPNATAPWSTWTFWQYGESTIAGINGAVDADVFNGTAASLGTYVIGGEGNNATVVSSSVPSTVVTGKTFTATITMNNSGGTVWTNTGANPYRLGSQNPQDNFTWGFNRVALPSSPIKVGSNAVFTFTATAPMTAGAYVFSWQMVQEGKAWFGDTYTTFVSVVIPGPGTNFGNYTLDTGDINPTTLNGSWLVNSECGINVHYTYLSDTNCTQFSRDAKWFPGITAAQYSGRGWFEMDALLGGTYAAANVYYHLRDSSDNELWTSPAIDQCNYHCVWYTLYSGNLTVSGTGILGGAHIFTADSGTNSTCGSCGHASLEAAQVHMFGARWIYIDDWTCLGAYASTNVSDTSNRTFNEASLYLYPAVDTSHGNVITAAMGLNGKAPGRVTTGDCNSTNTLNFGGSVNGVNPAGNAAAYGNANNADSYGFAWMFVPAGAGPQFFMGSDDGNRLWVNGTLVTSTNASRGLTRDQDHVGPVSLPAGWNRVLFKVHNFTGGFQGTVSLRNGGNASLNEPSVNYHDLGGYYSYGLGYEQDPWYPQIVVTNFCGKGNPTNGTVFYTNSTTAAGSGTSNGQGPVPYWRTMQYQWGYGLGNADSNYADVSGTPTATSWSHTTPGVTGHRRFLFFAVSQSGRTSFQNSGTNGGSLFQDAGNYARFYDVYVDNLAPVNPAFSSVTAASTSEIDLAWTIPLDLGVNVAPGSTESAGGAGNQDSQNWYRVGDVGVQVYRNGSVLSAWGTGTVIGDTGLAANTAYTYTLEARDNNTSARGAWNNSTGQQRTNVAWTLSVPPLAGSIAPSQPNPQTGSNITWTAVNGFGGGIVQYYRYAWDTSPTHAWADTEAQWSGGTIVTMATSPGAWYLHVKGYNGADVGNGTFDYSVNATASASSTTLASSENPAAATSNVTFTARVAAVAPATGTPSGNVVFLANGAPFSTNVLQSGSASASTTALPVGTNAIVAQYGGDLYFLGSADSLQQVIESLAPCSQTNAVVGITDNLDGTFTIAFVGTPQAQYYVAMQTNLPVTPGDWTAVWGSTITVTNSSGLWQFTVTNTAPQGFYRSAAVSPCP